MSISQFDNQAVDALISDMRDALELVAAQHGLKLKRKHCTYRLHSCPVPFTFEVERTDADGNEVTPESEAYQRQANLYGLKPEWLWQWADSQNGRVQVVGLKPRNRKYPVIVRREDGAMIKMTVRGLNIIMAARDAA